MVVFSSGIRKFFQDRLNQENLESYLVFNNKKELVHDNERETVYRIKKGITIEKSRKIVENHPLLIRPTWHSRYGGYPEKNLDITYHFILTDSSICSIERMTVPFEKLTMRNMIVHPNYAEEANYFNPDFSGIKYHPGYFPLRIPKELIDGKLTIRHKEIMEPGSITIEGPFDKLFSEFCDFARVGREGTLYELVNTRNSKESNSS